MTNEKTYQLMVAKMNEVAVVPPQTLGSFTHLYKRIVPFFKYYPWRSAVLISFAATVLLYFFLGATLVRLASILQFGF